MSLETLLYVKAAHVLGFVLWIAGLATVYWLLQVHARLPAEAHATMSATERRLAMVMDLGATVAIAAGLVLALGGPINAFKTGGWLHAKLTLVVLGVLAVHGFVRVKVKRFRQGQVAEVPGWPWLVLLASTAGIVLLATTTLLHK